MSRGFMHVARVVGLTSLMASWSPAQDPTFSLEVTEINGIPLRDGPVAELSASPGDILTAEILVRDWSIDGVALRAFQAQLDQRGYTSGYEGTICAVDFDKTTAVQKENKKNAFVDTTRPDYVFAGVQNFAITDTVSPSHRWLGALIDLADSRIAKQDGTKYYCGTLRLKVSDHARGPFTLRLLEQAWASTLRDPKNNPIRNLSFIPLTINVGPLSLRLLASDPPSGAIDARPSAGWDRIRFQYNGASEKPSKDDFKIDDGTAHPPRIKSVSVTESSILLELDHGITRGVWTTITHRPSGTGSRVASLPGDVNNDGATDASDVSALVDSAVFANELPLYRSDLDRDGAYTVKDVLRLIDLLAEPGAYRAKLKHRNLKRAETPSPSIHPSRRAS